MPIMNGVEAATKIRELQREDRISRDLSLVLVSGDRLTMEEQGIFDQSVSKPISKKDLKRVLRSLQ